MLNEVTFMYEMFIRLLPGIPLTLQLAATSIACGGCLGLILALMRTCGWGVLDAFSKTYIALFRGTPLLVQIYLIYYGLSQFPELRSSVLWPFLRQPWWCAVLALSLNTAAYVAEIIRGSIITVPKGQIEAAMACGMSTALMYRRIIIPQGLVRMLPAYGNEVILMVKATALASTITLMEVTGLAAQAISETYRPVEVFAAAGVIYLGLNFLMVCFIRLLERKTSPESSTVTKKLRRSYF
ncbi:ABC transporter permease [Pantoea sp. YR343]|uniref:ABC transporter permease n=1 Tax=Pantoea sp. YR343 TaxID=1144341 RepID=UPI0002711507|nr:ABC transporter permease [Pantoea sp. YR343]KAJ9431815.1 ABC transporter permease [Pantoea sp. YR343]